MKQPELGKKIFELRKSRGLTQEELVEKCNIGVRTIQRIEAGEVTPRSYTIKTILAALDYDINLISDEKDKKAFIKWAKQLFLIDINKDESSDYFIKQLNLAWIIGLVYFVLGFLESAADYMMYTKDLIVFNKYLYVIIKVLVLISFFYFQSGYVLIGDLFKNYLLKITSFVLIACNILLIGYDISSVFFNAGEREHVMGGFALTFGCIGIVYGIALIRLKTLVGGIAKYAGVFEIISGCFLISILLAFVGLITLIPAELFEIIMIYKIVELIKAKQIEIKAMNI